MLKKLANHNKDNKANLQFPIFAESQLNGTAALISGLIQILRTDYESSHNFYSIAVLCISVAVI